MNKKMIVSGAACALAASSVFAADFPTKAVRIIVPFAPGGGSDITARQFSAKLTEAFGQQFVVDNRGGANGNLGMDICARAGSDGYTICMPDGNIMTLNPYA